MAGLALSLDDFAARLSGLAAAAAHLDMTVALKQINVLAMAEARTAFDQGASPDGAPWLPLKRPRALKGAWGAKVSKKRKKTGQGDLPLRDTGKLMASLIAQGAEGHVERIGSDSLETGTNLEYAAIHQFGGTVSIPEQTRGKGEKPFVFPVEDLSELGLGMLAGGYGFGTRKKKKKGKKKKQAKAPAGMKLVFSRKIKAHTVTIPARPFLGWNDHLLENAGDVIADEAERQMGERLG
jgi:phage gpG-like protein